MEIEKEIETNGIREERARRKKRTACSTGAAIAEYGSRTGGSTLQEEGDASGSVPVESNEALVYRAVTIQLLNKLQDVRRLRIAYTFVKAMSEHK